MTGGMSNTVATAGAFAPLGQTYCAGTPFVGGTPTIAVGTGAATGATSAAFAGISASVANQPFVARGWNPPYAAGTRVHSFATAKETGFVRVHGFDNQQGAFMVRAKEIAGMSPADLQKHLGLPKVPTHISDVTVPAGTTMQIGRVAAQPEFGVFVDGGIQYELLQQIPGSAFTNMRPLR